MGEMVLRPTPHNAGGGTASGAIHDHINDFLMCTGLRGGLGETELPCFTAVRAEKALMSGSTFAATHHAFSRGTGGTADTGSP